MSQKALEEFFRRLSEDPALQKEACETSALFSGTAPDDGEIFPAIARLARKYGFPFAHRIDVARKAHFFQITQEAFFKKLQRTEIVHILGGKTPV